MRFYILDDNLEYAEDLAAMLESHVGGVPVWFLRGQDYLRQLEGASYRDLPDVCFIDQFLEEDSTNPGEMTYGTSVIRDMRNRGFLAPVVLLTSAEDPQIAFSAAASGANMFASKEELESEERLREVVSAAVLAGAKFRETVVQQAEHQLLGSVHLVREFIHDMKEVLTPMGHITTTASEELSRLCSAVGEYPSEEFDPERCKNIARRATVCISELRKHLETGGAYLKQLREFAQSGECALDPVDVPLKSFIDDLVAECLAQQRPRSVQVPEVSVSIDVGAVGRIARSLLRNVEHHVDGEIQVDVSCVAAELESLRVLKLVVRDHGRGIALQYRRRIFDPGVSAGVLVPGVTGGWGLGLAIARRFAELHEVGSQKGRIYCKDPAEGAGIEFVAELPLGELT